MNAIGNYVRHATHVSAGIADTWRLASYPRLLRSTAFTTAWTYRRNRLCYGARPRLFSQTYAEPRGRLGSAITDETVLRSTALEGQRSLLSRLRVWGGLLLAAGGVAAIISVVKPPTPPEDVEGTAKLAGDWEMAFLRTLPLRVTSRWFGAVASLELPLWLRRPVYGGWAWAFDANLAEAERDVLEYASLQEFFTRRLAPGARTIQGEPGALLSPVDGRVYKVGEVVISTAGRRDQQGVVAAADRDAPTSAQTVAIIEQVKGCSFSVESLLGAPPNFLGGPPADPPASSDTEGRAQPASSRLFRWFSWRKQAKGARAAQREAAIGEDLRDRRLLYCTLYLAPGDYHRIHAPCDWTVSVMRHIAGYLFPVNRFSVRWIPGLYNINERVVLQGCWEEGFMGVVAVGATNVGNIGVAWEPDFHANSGPLPEPTRLTMCEKHYGSGHAVVLKESADVQRQHRSEGGPSQEPCAIPGQPAGESGELGRCVLVGDEMAVFKLGSTVVLVFEAPRECAGPGFMVSPGDVVRLGQPLWKKNGS